MTETYLFIDTETTGFKRSGSLIQEGQARVCQIAMILTNKYGRTLSEFQTLIQPDFHGWTISAGAHGVHGITDDDCKIYGMPQSSAMVMYNTLYQAAQTIVAHNVNFDRGMMEIEAEYYGGLKPNQKPWFCTMGSNSHLAGGKSLANCLQYYCDRKSNNAHDAMADAKACRDIFFAMRGVMIA